VVALIICSPHNKLRSIIRGGMYHVHMCDGMAGTMVHGQVAGSRVSGPVIVDAETHSAQTRRVVTVTQYTGF
jgi:hypothetical protein